MKYFIRLKWKIRLFFQDLLIPTLITLCVLIIMGFGGYLAYKYEQEYYYKYIDLDNNEGYAEECAFTDKSTFSGGMGTMTCFLKDGTVIQVKQYKVVKRS